MPYGFRSQPAELMVCCTVLLALVWKSQRPPGFTAPRFPESLLEKLSASLLLQGMAETFEASLQAAFGSFVEELSVRLCSALQIVPLLAESCPLKAAESCPLKAAGGAYSFSVCGMLRSASVDSSAKRCHCSSV
jgi:hypothetical protein